MKCENCKKYHDGEYGSSRFCSSFCARSFSTKKNRKKRNKKISKALKIASSWIKYNKEHYQWKQEYRICLECKKDFLPNSFRQKFCSRLCARRRNIKLGLESLIRKNPKEWSKIHKKAYAKGNNYVAGGTTKWLKYKQIKVQGTFEFRACIILDYWKSCKIKDWEYTNDRFKYCNREGELKTYNPDFKVINFNDSFYYIEVKGYKKENDDFKWNAVRKLYILEVWFQADLENFEREFVLEGSSMRPGDWLPGPKRVGL